jgi:hypothetical protein
MSKPKQRKIEQLLPLSVDKTDWKTILSDHLPILYNLPIAKESHLATISYNVLDTNLPVGFADKNKSGCSFGEDKETRERRNIRIIDFLREAQDRHQTSFICLQESTENINNRLQTELGNNWTLIPDASSSSPVFYDTTKFGTVTAIKIDDCRYADSCSASYFEWTNKQTQQRHSSVIINVHLPHADEASEKRKQIAELIDLVTKKGESLTSSSIIIMGDFNYRIHSVDSTLQDNATGVIPLLFRDGNVTHDFTEGAFLATSLAIINGDEKTGELQLNTSEITQVKGKPVHPDTREIYEQEELDTETSLSIQDFNEALIPEQHELAPGFGTVNEFITRLHNLDSVQLDGVKINSWQLSKNRFNITNLRVNTSNPILLLCSAGIAHRVIEKDGETLCQYNFNFNVNPEHKTAYFAVYTQNKPEEIAANIQALEKKSSALFSSSSTLAKNKSTKLTCIAAKSARIDMTSSNQIKDVIDYLEKYQTNEEINQFRGGALGKLGAAINQHTLFGEQKTRTTSRILIDELINLLRDQLDGLHQSPEPAVFVS